MGNGQEKDKGLGEENDKKTIEKNKFIALIGEKATIKFISDGHISKGYLTQMWNYLFRLAYNDGNDYFYQCGDDIIFQNIDWLSECIKQLKKQKDIGVCGPINPPNYKILTQTLVSRKHWEIFGCYFPPQIKNWWCDDWINYVYLDTDERRRFAQVSHEYLIEQVQRDTF